jgi:hypothetical protein
MSRPWPSSSVLVEAMRRAASLLLASLSALGCKGPPMASSAECERLLDRYIDLKLSENPTAPRLSTEERSRLRGRIALEVLSDSDVKQVKTQCLTQVTQGEYDCAVKASTSQAWNDCIE